MKKILCVMLAVLLASVLFACGETTETQPSGTAGTEGTEPAEGTDSPEATSGTEATETTEPSQETESTSYTELTESTKTTESTEPSGTTGTAETVAPDGTPVVIVTNGTQSVSCYITEQSPGTAGGFDLTEDYTLLPTLTGDSFSLVAAESEPVFYISYMLYDADFSSLGTYPFNDQLQIIDTASETGTYYVRIAVNIGDPILYTDAYYAWAILELTE